MNREQNHSAELALENLWARYREACEAPGQNANFMPQLWESIEKKRNRFQAFEHIGRVFMSAAAVLTLVFGGVLAFESFEQQRQLRGETYIDVLSAEHASSDTPDIAPFHLDSAPVRGQSNH